MVLGYHGLANKFNFLSAHGLIVQKKQRVVSFLRKSRRKKDTSLEGEEQKKTQGKREGCSLLGMKKEQVKQKKNQ